MRLTAFRTRIGGALAEIGDDELARHAKNYNYNYNYNYDFGFRFS
jgi:hypothetical protein